MTPGCAVKAQIWGSVRQLCCKDADEALCPALLHRAMGAGDTARGCYLFL